MISSATPTDQGQIQICITAANWIAVTLPGYVVKLDHAVKLTVNAARDYLGPLALGRPTRGARLRCDAAAPDGCGVWTYARAEATNARAL